jgi:inner membrane protein
LLSGDIRATLQLRWCKQKEFRSAGRLERVATAFTHAFAAVAAGATCLPKLPRRFFFAGAVLAVVPDLDVIAFKLGIPYEHALGHRGFTHSLLFAIVLGASSALVLRREMRAALYFIACVASHGMLDALTNGGLGVGFFIPFDDARYFFAWRPIDVSPISPRAFFTGRAFRVLASELLVVWLPLGALWIATRIRGRSG